MTWPAARGAASRRWLYYQTKYAQKGFNLPETPGPVTSEWVSISSRVSAVGVIMHGGSARDPLWGALHGR